MSAEYDAGGSIGKRYRRQDEIGTPWGITVDHQTMEDDTVTLRDRDTLEQVRLPVAELADELAQRPARPAQLREVSGLARRLPARRRRSSASARRRSSPCGRRRGGPAPRSTAARRQRPCRRPRVAPPPPTRVPNAVKATPAPSRQRRGGSPRRRLSVSRSAAEREHDARSPSADGGPDRDRVRPRDAEDRRRPRTPVGQRLRRRTCLAAGAPLEVRARQHPRQRPRQPPVPAAHDLPSSRAPGSAGPASRRGRSPPPARPISLIEGVPVPANTANTATMISAALEIVAALARRPWATACVVSPVAS